MWEVRIVDDESIIDTQDQLAWPDTYLHKETKN